MVGSSAPSAAELEAKIAKTQAKVRDRRSKETVLTRDIARYSRRVSALERRVDSLAARQSNLEVDLQAKRALLSATQTELRAERVRVVRLRKRLQQVRSTLASRLVDQYKAGRTDLASVVLEADGFEQLLERGEHLSRLATQDRKILTIVAAARAQATKTEGRLAALQQRQRRTTAAVTARRNEVARVRSSVTAAQTTVVRARGDKRALLSNVKERRADLEEDLDAMQAQQAKIRGALTPGASAGPIKKGTGQLIYPINGTFTSSFGMRWGRLHAGIDVAIPIGTPLRAADGGRVALAGPVSGYGNYTCVQHSASLSTCYAHQDSIGVSVGQTVRQGQVIGRTGNTGRSTGPHLHFEVRLNGTPVNPMNYL